MSSSIDNVICPICGQNAQREQDNKTGEVSFYCSSCGWDGENEEELKDDWNALDISDDDEDWPYDYFSEDK